MSKTTVLNIHESCIVKLYINEPSSKVSELEYRIRLFAHIPYHNGLQLINQNSKI